MTPNEAFKIGFMVRCAEEGLDGDGIRERLEKASSWTSLPLWALAGLSIAPPLAGAGIGFTLGSMARHEPGEVAKDIRHAELLSAYKKALHDLQQLAKSQRIDTTVD